MAGILGDDSDLGGKGPFGNEPSYVASLGRIGGKLLSANLLRNGADLAFETDLLYLQVNPIVRGSSPLEDGDPNWGKSGSGLLPAIGINTDTPSHLLTVNGTSRVNNRLIVTGVEADIDNIKIQTNGTITTQVGPININPAGPDPYIEHERVITSQLMLDDNFIKVTATNQNLELRPITNASTIVDSDATVYGTINISQNLIADQDVNVKGQVTVGNSPFDTVAVRPDFTQSIIPGSDILYNFGTNTKRWRNVNVFDNVHNDVVISTTATIGNQMRFATNQITTTQSNDDLFLSSDEGTVILERISFKDNTITNLDNTPISFTSTGRGYLKFVGTNGLLIPAGTTDERQSLGVGDTRWNTDLQILECFDGSVYQVATGGGATVTTDIMEDFGHVYTLIFG